MCRNSIEPWPEARRSVVRPASAGALAVAPPGAAGRRSDGDGPRAALSAPLRAALTLIVMASLLAVAGWPTARAARPVATEPLPDPTASPATAVRTQRSYRLPALWLQRADGSRQTLQQALSDGRPVVLSFMFSSCATVCPITNQTLAAFSQLLGDRQAAVNIVSISIDPDHDSVTRLAEYAKRTGAAGSFYTSDPGTSEAVQRAFDVWRGDKMNHQPVFLITTNPADKWLRIDGLVTPRQLLADYLGQVQKTSPVVFKK